MIEQFQVVADAVRLEVKPEHRKKIGICGAGGIVDGRSSDSEVVASGNRH